MGETSKARGRRERDGFFEAFIQGRGLDIGPESDPLTPDCEQWDTDRGDGTYLIDVENSTYDWVYSSHCLEHLEAPEYAIQNWWRVLKRGGYLIIMVPHRDLFEKKLLLPSRVGDNHKSFFMPQYDEAPDTKGLMQLINANLTNFELVYMKICDEGYDAGENADDPNIKGEYSIEVVLKKL